MQADSITPREAFIYICFNMISADREIDDREVEKLFDIIKRYGFQYDEVKKISDMILELGTNEAFERGMEYVEIAKQLDEEMKKNLIQALLEIGEADGKVEDSELSMLFTVQMAFGTH